MGQYTDKMIQKYVKNVSFCPCSDPIWPKWVKWLIWVFLCRKTIFVIEFVTYWRFLRKVYNKYLCIAKVAYYIKRNDILATPPFSETIPKVFWLKIERVKVKNIREDAYSATGDIFLRDTAYFIVIQWSIRSYIIESQWNMPYPV